jgi:hypothetical protein
MDKLSADVQARISTPLDVLEVAAVIESMGVSDSMAQAAFGQPDTFHVAEAVLAKIRSAPKDRTLPLEPPRDFSYTPRGRGTHWDSARHPFWAMVPSGALLLVIWGVSWLGKWPPLAVVALAVGMSTGILVTSGISLAVGQRASGLISLGKNRAVRRLLVMSTVTAAAATVGVTECLLVLPFHDFAFLGQHRPVVILSASALAVLWMLAGALSLVSLGGLPGAALLIGIGCAAVVNIAVEPLTAHHLLVALAVAFLLSVLVMAGGLRWALPPRPGARRSPERLPSVRYLLLDALPNVVYGTLAAVVFACIHVIGWIKLNGGPQVTTLELGLFLPLAPAALGGGRAERTMQRFWARVKDLQKSAITGPRPMTAELRALYGAEVRRYLGGLAIASGITIGVVELLLLRGAFRAIAPSANADQVQVVFLAALVGYGTLSMGYFNSLFCLSLARLGGAMRAIALGSAVTLASACVLAASTSFQFLPFAFVAGGVVYSSVSYRAVRTLLSDADYHYETAL